MTLTYRFAKYNDARLIYTWANDPLVREASFYKDPIKWDSHIEWFASRLNDSNTMILIFQREKLDIGVVRIETKEKTIIGISIDAEFRGKKLGPQMLQMACREFWKNHNNPIFAYIKKNNIASIKSFQKAGFTYRRDTIINDIKSVELIGEKC